MTTLARRTRLVAGICFVAAGLAIAAADADEAAPPKEILVLFVGNSQIYYNDLPRIVEALADSAPPDQPRIRTDRFVSGGASLESHWNLGDGKDTARAKVAEGMWDDVILQDYSFYTTTESYTKYARLFHELIRQHGAKTVLLSTASFPDMVPKSFLELHDRHVVLGKELSVPVAAGGKAWLAYWGDSPTSDEILALYDKDKGHPGPKGSYIYACTLYAVLTGHSPLGLTHRVPGQPEDTITLAEAQRFQEAAWQVHQVVNGEPASAP